MATCQLQHGNMSKLGFSLKMRQHSRGPIFSSLKDMHDMQCWELAKDKIIIALSCKWQVLTNFVRFLGPAYFSKPFMMSMFFNTPFQFISSGPIRQLLPSVVPTGAYQPNGRNWNHRKEWVSSYCKLQANNWKSNYIVYHDLLEMSVWGQ